MHDSLSFRYCIRLKSCLSHGSCPELFFFSPEQGLLNAFNEAGPGSDLPHIISHLVTKAAQGSRCGGLHLTEEIELFDEGCKCTWWVGLWPKCLNSSRGKLLQQGQMCLISELHNGNHKKVQVVSVWRKVVNYWFHWEWRVESARNYLLGCVNAFISPHFLWMLWTHVQKQAFGKQPPGSCLGFLLKKMNVNLSTFVTWE